jgi:ABC-type branched-subunit amino acid transport system ATPase component
MEKHLMDSRLLSNLQKTGLFVACIGLARSLSERKKERVLYSLMLGTFRKFEIISLNKYLKVFDHVLVDTKQWRNASGHEWEYPISDKELIDQTLKLLNLVRSALIYVSLAAYDEEARKRSEIADGLLGDMQLFEVDDKYR